MVQPARDASRPGLPGPSKGDLDALGVGSARGFQPSLYRTIGEALRAEQFAEQYLNLTVDYQYLSNNGCYLGAAVMGDEQALALYDPATDRPYLRVYHAGTILLDMSLQGHETLLRFTLMHECAHQILHRYYFSKQKRSIVCRAATVMDKEDRSPLQGKESPIQWTDPQRMEWQANYLASCTLMPESRVRVCAQYLEIAKYYQYHIERGMRKASALRVAGAELAPSFRVSTRAAQIRLQELGIC